MTVGAAGALNVILHSILDPDDEVVIFKPFFPEYQFYVDNHQGVSVFCDYNESFEPSMESFKSLINKKTKAIILNSPNNPTGITYSANTIHKIVNLVKEYEKNLNLFLGVDARYPTHAMISAINGNVNKVSIKSFI